MLIEDTSAADVQLYEDEGKCEASPDNILYCDHGLI